MTANLTKRQIKTRKNMQLIMDSAIRLFNEQGYNETTIGEISRDTGLSNGSIYHLFSSKKDILKQIYNQYINVSLDLTKDISQKVSSPYVYLYKHLMDTRDLWLRTGPMLLINKHLWVTSRTMLGCSPIQREELTAFIAYAIEAGTISAGLDIADTVEFLFTLQRGLLYGWTSRNDFDIVKYSQLFYPPVLRALIDGTIRINLLPSSPSF